MYTIPIIINSKKFDIPFNLSSYHTEIYKFLKLESGWLDKNIKIDTKNKRFNEEILKNIKTLEDKSRQAIRVNKYLLDIENIYKWPIYKIIDFNYYFSDMFPDFLESLNIKYDIVIGLSEIKKNTKKENTDIEFQLVI